MRKNEVLIVTIFILTVLSQTSIMLTVIRILPKSGVFCRSSHGNERTFGPVRHRVFRWCDWIFAVGVARMNLTHLKYAVEVAKTGSITQAAESLYMGQPNLSKAIRELEATVGVAIFKRTPKGVMLTPQGEEFIARAKNILGQIDEMENLFRIGRENQIAFSVCVPRAKATSPTPLHGLSTGWI